VEKKRARRQGDKEKLAMKRKRSYQGQSEREKLEEKNNLSFRLVG
jgi:hypothetical protein